MRKPLIISLLLICSLASSAQDYAYSWRGIMIDVSRHFLPIEYLYKEVDAMSYCGLNHLHLHLTDAAGWRVEIKSRPRLTSVGAYRTEANWKMWWNSSREYSDSINGKGGYYTQEEMKALVKYASEKGIEVIPEIEFPAHSEEVIAAYPEVAYNKAEMNMHKPETYRLMRDVLEEIAQIFPSKYIHVGGDESATQHDFQPEGMRRIKQICDSLHRKVIVWDEALTDNPSDSDMTIMVWHDISTAKRAISLGHDVILCPGKYCYLDKSQDSPATQPESAGGYLPIDSVYMLPNPLGGETSMHILGVQGNIWTEYVPTPKHLEYMLWPRAFAIAEIGREGVTDKRDVKAFHKRALAATKYLRGELDINAFDLKNETGQRKTPKNIRSIPYTLTYNTSPHPAYSGTSSTLHDNILGGWSNNDGSWQGFIGRNGMNMTLDLGQQTALESINIDFMQCVAPEIFFPYNIIISTSEDGYTFTSLSNQDYSSIYAQKSEDYQTFSIPCKASARFVRIQALPGPRQGWIFCSEIYLR